MLHEEIEDVKRVFMKDFDIKDLAERLRKADYVVMAEATTAPSITTPPKALGGYTPVGDGSMTAAEYRYELECGINAKPRIRAIHLLTPCRGIDLALDLDGLVETDVAAIFDAAMSSALVVADASALLGYVSRFAEPRNVIDLGLLVRSVFPDLLFEVNKEALERSECADAIAKGYLSADLESICLALGISPPTGVWPSGRQWQLKVLSDDSTNSRVGAISHADAIHARAFATGHAFEQLFSSVSPPEKINELRYRKGGLEFLDIFSKAAIALSKMHIKGMAVSSERIDEMQAQELDGLEVLASELVTHVPSLAAMLDALKATNAHATAEIRGLLGEYSKSCEIDLPKDENGVAKVGADVLALAGASDLPGLAAWTKLEACKRRLNGAVDLRILSKTGADGVRRIHPLLSIKTVSLRASCKAPNAQGFDASTKSAIVASPGHVLIEADFGAIEIRIAAAGASKLLLEPRPADGALAGMYDSAKASGMPLVRLLAEGLCPHNFTALQLLKKPELQSVESRMALMRTTPSSEVRKLVDDVRQAAKVINLGLLYGMSARGLWQKGIIDGVQWTLEDATNARASWFAQFPEIDYACAIVKGNHKSKSATKMLVKDRYSGDVSVKDVYVYQSETLGGRTVSALDDRVVNLRAQSTGATLLFKAIVNSSKRIQDSIVMCVHDSILIEAPKERADVFAVELSEVMQRTGAEFLSPYGIPTVVDISRGANWAEMM